MSGRSTAPAPGAPRAPQPAPAVAARPQPLDAAYAEARSSGLGSGGGFGGSSATDAPRRSLGEYRTPDGGAAEPVRQDGRQPAGGLPPAAAPVNGAPLSAASGQPNAQQNGQPAPGSAERESAVVHEPVSRFVELPPEPRPTPRPTPRPIVVDDDLDVPDFLK